MTNRSEFLFFWGEEDKLSNFYLQDFKIDNIDFFCSEQAIMYYKAKLFGAHKVAAQILKGTTPGECKHLGRSRDIPFNQEIWDEEKIALYERVLLHKFRVPELKEYLLNTGDLHLVEASPFDKIWGIGLAEDHKDARNPAKWRGQNLLGQILMTVRTLLRQEEVMNQ
jgi:hypothetical protein